MGRIIALALLWALSSIAFAEPSDNDPCQRAAMTGGDLSRAMCSDNRVMVYEKDVNTTYEALKSALKNDARKRNEVVEGQRAWLQYRNKSCQFWSGIYNPQRSLCMESLTRARSEELIHMYKCFTEGGNEC